MLRRRAMPREEAERVRVHLEELRGGRVDPREGLDQLVERRERSLGPQPVAAEPLGRGQGDEAEPAQIGEVLGRKRRVLVGLAGAGAEGRCERLDRLEPGLLRVRRRAVHLVSPM